MPLFDVHIRTTPKGGGEKIHTVLLVEADRKEDITIDEVEQVSIKLGVGSP